MDRRKVKVGLWPKKTEQENKEKKQQEIQNIQLEVDLQDFENALEKQIN